MEVFSRKRYAHMAICRYSTDLNKRMYKSMKNKAMRERRLKRF